MDWMRVSNLKGVAVYRIDEDDEITWLDCQIAGLKVVRARGDFDSYFRKLREVMQELGSLKGYEYLREYTLRYRARRRQGRGFLIFAVFAFRGRRVVGAVLGSTRPGLLRTLDKKLASLGWQRLFFLEMKLPSKHAPRLGSTRSRGSGV
ncbi:MAG: hypothetical protein QXI90_06750 [Thermofilum sp.]